MWWLNLLVEVWLKDCRVENIVGVIRKDKIDKTVMPLLLKEKAC